MINKVCKKCEHFDRNMKYNCNLEGSEIRCNILKAHIRAVKFLELTKR